MCHVAYKHLMLTIRTSLLSEENLLNKLQKRNFRAEIQSEDLLIHENISVCSSRVSGQTPWIKCRIKNRTYPLAPL